MPRLDLRARLIDPRSPDHRPRRAAYALPRLFTAGNIFLGYIAILRSIRAATLPLSGGAGAQAHWEAAALAIGVAAFLDGLDGRIARLTNTTSDFGREMDSLADVISFGIAPRRIGLHLGRAVPGSRVEPGVAAAVEQCRLPDRVSVPAVRGRRLARFNVQKNPVPKNPGKPDRKYFVGLPIPAAAAMVAAVVYAA